MTLKYRRLLPLIFLALAVTACSNINHQQAGIVKQTADEDVHLTGEALFNERCRECHKILGKGEAVGTDLANIGEKADPAFLVQVIREPLKVFGAETTMPAGEDLSAKQISSLVDYM